MRPSSARCSAWTRTAAAAAALPLSTSRTVAVMQRSLATGGAASVGVWHPCLLAAYKGLRVCAGPRCRGTDEAAMRVLVTAQRYVSTGNGGGDDASTLPDSQAAFDAQFGHYPIGERLAALAVAQHMYRARVNSATPYMPINVFMRKLSTITRDEMLQRQLDALEYVAASQLMTLVDEKGGPLSLSSLRRCGSDGGSDGAPADTPVYAGVVYVNLTVPLSWMLRCGSKRSAHKRTTAEEATIATHAASESVRAKPLDSADPTRHTDGSDRKATAQSEADATRGTAVAATVRDTAIRKALLEQLRHTEARHTAAREAGEVNVPRYVPLTTLYNSILRTAGNAAAVRDGFAVPTVEVTEDWEVIEKSGVSYTDAELQVLKRLQPEVLETVVHKISVTFTVGRRASTEEESRGGYPSLESRPLWSTRGPKPPFPCFVALRYATERLPPRFRYVQPRIVSSTRQNNYGGWGADASVPTKEDVYEVLKYVPVNWGSFSLLQMPPELRKKHIRCSTPSLWYRRQPFYFELRDVRGVVEIRRSIVLHPEAHGLTREDAWEVLEMQLATGEANHMLPVSEDGVLLRPSENVFDTFVSKFLYRVCPSYFAPLSFTLLRCTRQNVTEPILFASVQRHPQDFEVLRTRFSDIPLVRRRSGAESSRWRDDFVADLERYPEDVRGILLVCNYLCPGWDRPEYVYVRLSESEQGVVGGYEGMVKILARHPMIFRVGKHFVCRADPSNPLAPQQTEPAPTDTTAMAGHYQENPYQTLRELALVFHYVIPDGEPCTAAYLVDCASPVMRVELPPRVVTVLQAFPKMFACTETSPGVHSIRKLRQTTRRTPSSTPAMAADGTPDATATGDRDNAKEAEAMQMLEEELAEEDSMTRAETIQAVRTLIPDGGVEATQLLMWASMSVQRAACQHSTGLLRLVSECPNDFRVVENDHVKMIYKR